MMSQILDAVESGERTITAADIAATTGLTQDSVRQCRSRGFRRLERIVRDESLEPSTWIDDNTPASDASTGIEPRRNDSRVS